RLRRHPRLRGPRRGRIRSQPSAVRLLAERGSLPMTAMPAELFTGPLPGCDDRGRPDPQASDAELAALARHDAEAFGILYDRYADQVFRMVYHRLGDRQDAEDVTAEVFVKALRAIDVYRPSRAPFWGWLHRIAT